MKAIYEPSGKAKEYGELACNLYRGCGHGCTYCYAPSVLRMDRQEFYNNPQPREGIIEALKKDAKRIHEKHYKKLRAISSKYPLDHKGDISNFYGNLKKSQQEYPPRPEVFLCFTTDPYQPINREHQLTRQAIEILHANEIAVNILTKGRITDFNLLAKRPDLSKVGVTLTHHSKPSPWVDDYEPNASSSYFRIWNLKNAKEKGIKTWVSLEPVIHRSSVLELIKATHGIVDEFMLGKWNYDARAKDIDWHKFVNDAIELLEGLGCKYYIKEDLRKYI